MCSHGFHATFIVRLQCRRCLGDSLFNQAIHVILANLACDYLVEQAKNLTVLLPNSTVLRIIREEYKQNMVCRTTIL